MNKRLTYGSLMLVTATILATSPAWARGQRGPKDANNDGVITLEEVHAHVEEKFSKKDTNKDGSITLDEMKASATERFNRRDANNDGKITSDERGRSRGGPRNSAQN